MMDITFERELEQAINNWREWRDSQIRIIAYLKWETAGRPEGKSEDFWLEAEKEGWDSNRIEISTENIPSRIEVVVPPFNEYVPAHDINIEIPPLRIPDKITVSV